MTKFKLLDYVRPPLPELKARIKDLEKELEFLKEDLGKALIDEFPLEVGDIIEITTPIFKYDLGPDLQGKNMTKLPDKVEEAKVSRIEINRFGRLEWDCVTKTGKKWGKRPLRVDEHSATIKKVGHD